MEAITGLEVPDGWTLEQVDLNGTNIQVSMEKTGVKSVHRHQTQMNFSRIVSSDWRVFRCLSWPCSRSGHAQTFELAPFQREMQMERASMHGFMSMLCRTPNHFIAV